MKLPICVGITGASGAIYAARLLEVLRACGRDVHLSISPSATEVMRQELKLDIDLDDFRADRLLVGEVIHPSESQIPLFKSSFAAPANKNVESRGGLGRPGKLHYYHWQGYRAPMASGSFLTAGMVICPCSGATLSAVASGAAGNLIQRAAEVHLKERRPLVLVPRETPLSLTHIENMRRVTEAGAIVLPASPGWYHGVREIRDLVDFVVARICDQLGVEHQLTKRWGSE
jgi:flavin prenyltransferase